MQKCTLRLGRMGLYVCGVVSQWDDRENGFLQAIQLTTVISTGGWNCLRFLLLVSSVGFSYLDFSCIWRWGFHFKEDITWFQLIVLFTTLREFMAFNFFPKELIRITRANPAARTATVFLCSNFEQCARYLSSAWLHLSVPGVAAFQDTVCEEHWNLSGWKVLCNILGWIPRYCRSWKALGLHWFETAEDLVH